MDGFFDGEADPQLNDEMDLMDMVAEGEVAPVMDIPEIDMPVIAQPAVAPSPAPAARLAAPIPVQAPAPASRLDASIEAVHAQRAALNRPMKPGPVMDAAVEIYKKHGLAIRASDDIYILMQFLHDSMTSMDAKSRNEWSTLVDDAIAPLHDVREEIAGLASRQATEIAALQLALKSSAAEAKASIEAVMATALSQTEKRLDVYAEKMAAAAEVHFGTALRELVLSEVRIGLGRGMGTEVDMLRTAARDATAALAKASAGASAAPGKAKMAKKASILEEITALSNPAQATIGVLAVISFLAILKVFI